MTLKDHSFNELYDKHGERWLRAMEQADREVREQDPSDPIKHAEPAFWYIGEGEWAVFNDGGGVVEIYTEEGMVMLSPRTAVALGEWVASLPQLERYAD